MEIGKPQRIIEIQPLYVPIPQKPSEEPKPIVVEPEREKVAV